MPIGVNIGVYLLTSTNMSQIKYLNPYTNTIVKINVIK